MEYSIESILWALFSIAAAMIVFGSVMVYIVVRVLKHIVEECYFYVKVCTIYVWRYQIFKERWAWKLQSH